MNTWTMETEVGITNTGKRLVRVMLFERTPDGARVIRTWTEERD